MVDNMEKLEGGTLKAVVKCPQVGTFVCCLDRKLFFRGLVIGVLPDERLKILGVDSKCIKLAKLENVYEMSKDLCKFHANAVHCCLTEDSTAQDLWNEDLSGVFKSTLRECKLKMNVLYEVECFPPKFLVEISGHNEPMKVNVNINKWVCQQLLPEIKKVEEMSKEVDLITLLSEDALDPYSCLSEYDIKVPPREESKKVKGRCNDQHVESALEHHIIAEEEACIISEYYPTDETRICQFYAKRGFCWKVGCTKEHSDPSIGDKWTTDKISVFKEPFNRIAMPDVGDIIDLQVTYVSSGNCFFALLPDKYSDIGEFTEREPETLDGLTNALNLPQTIKNFQYLEADPCLGELILALSASGSWLRARVCELFDTAVEVYYVDYGTTETIPNSKKRLRKISPEFLHLPFQAVLCFLADLSVSEDEMLKEKGLNYLENLLLGKIVQGKLVSRSVLDSELQLVIWAAGGINVNEVMVHKGFCSKF